MEPGRIRGGVPPSCASGSPSLPPVSSAPRPAAAPIAVVDPRAAEFTQSLNGRWAFEYLPGLAAETEARFFEPGFDVSTTAMSVVTEAGLSVVVPDSLSEFRWIGQRPAAGYPGKDRLNKFGLFHLNREDLRFQGNRREAELALLTTAAAREWPWRPLPAMWRSRATAARRC